MKWSTNRMISVYLVQGRSNFLKWMRGDDNAYVTYDFTDSNERLFSFNESNEYYFIMENEKSDLDITGDVYIDINATLYDTTKALGFYDGSFKLNLDFNSEVILVLANPSKTHPCRVIIESSARVNLVFLVLAVLLLQIMCTTALCYCSCTYSKRTHNLYSNKFRSIELVSM